MKRFVSSARFFFRVAALASALLGAARVAPAEDGPAGSRAEVEALLKSVDELRKNPEALRRAAEQLDEAIAAAVAALEKIDAANKADREALNRRIEALKISRALLDAPSPPLAPSDAPKSSPDSSPGDSATPPAPPEIVALFKDRVQPIFEENCQSCHHSGRKRGGLDLSTRGALLKGGDKGPAIVPGSAKESLLYRLVAHEEQPFMPHKEDKLPDADIEALAKWIDGGAPYGNAPGPAAGIEPVSETVAAPTAKTEMVVTDKDREFWSFRRLQPAEPPAADDAAWSRDPVDRFVLAAMKAKGLSPSATADRRALIRRVYFDLIGLPPAPADVTTFANDNDPAAYEKLVDRLLASPQFGERWGRLWLDLARYADSGGYEFDYDRPTAYPYRDWVIRAFNDDMPYDTFLKWQLAGDEYEPENPDAITATGFIAAGPSVDNEQSEALRYDELDDIISTTSLSMLGMTIGCARCHDHKYDPIPQRDYYRMLSAFTTTKRVESFIAPMSQAESLRAKEESLKKTIESCKARLNDIQGEAFKRLRSKMIDAIPEGEATKEQREALRNADIDPAKLAEELKRFKDRVTPSGAEVRKELSAEDLFAMDLLRDRIKKSEAQFTPKVLTMYDEKAQPAENWLLGRGDVANKNEKVSLGFLSVVTPPQGRWADPKPAPPEGARSTHQRRAMAEWMTDMADGAGPLAARVMVNRIWARLFNEGIVATPSDFGAQGERPTHPELLEWLARDFVDNGWRVKRVIRQLMLTETYREGFEYNEEYARIDPGNDYLWKRAPRRLESEEIRDAVLTASGCINLKMFGPGVHVKMHPDAIATGSTAKWPLLEKDGPETWRRGVYVYLRRSVLEPMLEVFDGVSAAASCSRRMRTTVPTQALALLNSDFIIDQAGRFAERVKAGAEKPEQWIDNAYWLSLGRAPEPTERQMGLAFLARQAERYSHNQDDHAEPMRLALNDYCQILLNLNEFIYLD